MFRQNGVFIWDKVSTFKKTNGQVIRLRSGQAVIEYITVFIAITLLVVGFISRVHNSDKSGIMDNHFQDMVSQTLG